MNGLDGACKLISSLQGTSGMGNEVGFRLHWSGPVAVATLALAASSSELLNSCLPEAALEISVALGHSFHFGWTGLRRFHRLATAGVGLGGALSVTFIHIYIKTVWLAGARLI